MIDDLADLSHADLKAHWIKIAGCEPPISASGKFLKRALAYEMQCKTSSGLTRAEQRELADSLLPRNAKPSTPCRRRAAVKLVPGSRLLREWNGRSYTVSVIEEGFVYRDKIWPSLSAIARDITGAHWSGPRFFGVNGKAQ